MNVTQAIAETRRHLGGENEHLMRLSGAHTAVVTTLTFQGSVAQLAPQQVLELRGANGQEVVMVWSVDIENSQAEVRRNHDGAGALAFADGDLVVLSPRYTTDAVRRAVRDEIASLPGEGLYKRASVEVTYDGDQDGFDITPALADLLSPYSLETTVSGRPLEVFDFQRIGDLLRPTMWMFGGTQTATLNYRATLTVPSADTDDLTTAVGLPASAHDIVPLGAAIRLIGGKEALRADVHAQPHARRAEDVPPGTTTRVFSLLMAQHEQRIATEVLRLRARWPSRRR